MTKKINVITLLILFYSISVCSYFNYTNKLNSFVVSNTKSKESEKKQSSGSVNDNSIFTLSSITARK